MKYEGDFNGGFRAIGPKTKRQKIKELIAIILLVVLFLIFISVVSRPIEFEVPETEEGAIEYEGSST